MFGDAPPQKKASKIKQLIHSQCGSCDELLKSVAGKDDFGWAAPLAKRVADALHALKSDLPPFHAQFLVVDGKDIRQKFGDSETAANAKKFVEDMGPRLHALEQAKAKLVAHMRVG